MPPHPQTHVFAYRWWRPGSRGFRAQWLLGMRVEPIHIPFNEEIFKTAYHLGHDAAIVPVRNQKQRQGTEDVENMQFDKQHECI